MNRNCPFCTGTKTEILSINKKEYLKCGICGGIQLLPQYHVLQELQKERYLKHENTLTNKGYLSFLRSFIEPVFSYFESEFMEKKKLFTRIFDYGSGPEPCLVRYLSTCAMQMSLINQKNSTDRYLSQINEHEKSLQNECDTLLYYKCLSADADIRGWDPFFAPDIPFFNGGAELVLCLEVAEHFENPQEDFKRLASACAKGCYIAVGTMMLTEKVQFEKWWYKDDCTHTAFYTADSLAAIGAQNGLQVLMQTDRLCLFKKSD